MRGFSRGLDLLCRRPRGARRDGLEGQLRQNVLECFAARLPADDAKRYCRLQDCEDHPRARQMVGPVGVGAPFRKPAFHSATVNMIDAERADMISQAPDVDAIGFLHARLASLIAALWIALVGLPQRLEGPIKL